MIERALTRLCYEQRIMVEKTKEKMGDICVCACMRACVRLDLIWTHTQITHIVFMSKILAIFSDHDRKGERFDLN